MINASTTYYAFLAEGNCKTRRNSLHNALYINENCLILAAIVRCVLVNAMFLSQQVLIFDILV